MLSFEMKQLDCFLSGDDKCFAFLFHLRQLIFSVWEATFSYKSYDLSDCNRLYISCKKQYIALNYRTNLSDWYQLYISCKNTLTLVRVPKNNHVKGFLGSILTPTWVLGSFLTPADALKSLGLPTYRAWRDSFTCKVLQHFKRPRCWWG